MGPQQPKHQGEKCYWSWWLPLGWSSLPFSKCEWFTGHTSFCTLRLRRKPSGVRHLPPLQHRDLSRFCDSCSHCCGGSFGVQNVSWEWTGSFSLTSWAGGPEYSILLSLQKHRPWNAPLFQKSPRKEKLTIFRYDTPLITDAFLFQSCWNVKNECLGISHM